MEDLFTLGVLILLQLVLGFDNLLYISLESKRAPADQQSRVRRIGIGLAIALRIVLLVVLIKIIDLIKDPLFYIEGLGIKGGFTLRSLIELAGGGFILYTAMKEIWHMVSLEEADAHAEEKEAVNTNSIIVMIVIMNIVFSFDSILSAMALTDTIWVMATAIIIGGILMIYLADTVSNFLAKNRMYEVLGLFVLFIVGIMLVSEGGHNAHLELFGGHVEAMSKTTFYFVIFVLLVTDIVQGRYQKKILAERARVSQEKNKRAKEAKQHAQGQGSEQPAEKKPAKAADAKTAKNSAQAKEDSSQPEESSEPEATAAETADDEDETAEEDEAVEEESASADDEDEAEEDTSADEDVAEDEDKDKKA